MMSSGSFGPNTCAQRSPVTATVHHSNHAAGIAGGADAPTGIITSPLSASAVGNASCSPLQQQPSPTLSTRPMVKVTAPVPRGPHQRATSPLKTVHEGGTHSPAGRKPSPEQEQQQQQQHGRATFPMVRTSPGLLDRANAADDFMPGGMPAKVRLSDRPRFKSNTLPAHLGSRPADRKSSTALTATALTASPPAASRARSPARIRSRRRGQSLGQHHNHSNRSNRQANTHLSANMHMPSRTSTLSTKATTLSLPRQPSQLHLSNSVTSLKHATRTPAMLSLQTAMMGADLSGRAGDSGDETGSGSAGYHKDAGSGSRPASNPSGAAYAVDRVRAATLQRTTSQTHLTHVISRYMDHFPHSRPTTPNLRRQQSGGGGGGGSGGADGSASPQQQQQQPQQQQSPNHGCSPTSRTAHAGSPAAFMFKRSGSPHNLQQAPSTSLYGPLASKLPAADSHRSGEAATGGAGGPGGNQPRCAPTRTKVLGRKLPPLNAATRSVPPASSRDQQDGKSQLQAYPRLTAEALRQLQQETQHFGQWRSMYDMFLAPSPTPSDGCCSEASAPLFPARNAADATQEHEDLGLLSIVPTPSPRPPPTLQARTPKHLGFRFNCDQR